MPRRAQRGLYSGCSFDAEDRVRSPRRTAAPGACPSTSRPRAHLARRSPTRRPRSPPGAPRAARAEPRPPGRPARRVRARARAPCRARGGARARRPSRPRSGRRRHDRDRGTDLVAGERVERMRCGGHSPPVACCWRMYSAVPATNPSTSFAFPVTKSLKYWPGCTPRSHRGRAHRTSPHQLADGDELDRRGERVVVGLGEQRGVDDARVDDQHLDAVSQRSIAIASENTAAPTSTRRTRPRRATTRSPPPTTR